MAGKNIAYGDEIYEGIQTVKLPVSGGGNASYVETSDADAAADDIKSGKTAYVKGVKITGTHVCSGGGGTSDVTMLSGTVVSSNETQMVGGRRVLEVPSDGTVYDHYVVLLKALNTYVKSGEEFVEKSGLDFSGCTGSVFPAVSALVIYPNVSVGDVINDQGTYAASKLRGSQVRAAVSALTGAEENGAYVYAVEADKITIASQRNFVNTDFKIKYAYTVLAWND